VVPLIVADGFAGSSLRSPGEVSGAAELTFFPLAPERFRGDGECAHDSRAGTTAWSPVGTFQLAGVSKNGDECLRRIRYVDPEINYSNHVENMSTVLAGPARTAGRGFAAKAFEWKARVNCGVGELQVSPWNWANRQEGESSFTAKPWNFASAGKGASKVRRRSA
jgi:hypothetical protein